MRVATLTFIAASFLLAANAAPLGERGSVGHRTSENHAFNAAAATPPPWRAATPTSSKVAEDRVTQPTPPPWRRAPVSADPRSMSSPGADAPGWRVARASVLERVAQPTAPGWRREPVTTQTPGKSDASPVVADAPGWKKRATNSDADPIHSLSRSA
ncbi:hypothetical protein B0H19DRAFT_447471 [Mycena capillaripes]|nr:hypothetical protein B0H19DRAFT_1081261 [Mycena capillaripes]KAJ6533119.1 hypothetical protein B0H19DRAFT_447471 [Mycena capillaripes]